MKNYHELDYEEKIAKAITAHNAGYDIEAFTILFELIKQELEYYHFFRGGGGDLLEDADNLSYRELIILADKDKALSYRGVLELNLFRIYRNRIIHTIVTGEKIDSHLVDMWFKFGRDVNQRMTRKSEDYFYDNGCGNLRTDFYYF